MLLQNEHELIKNEDELLQNKHELVKNEDELLQNKHELVKNEDELLQNEHKLIKNEDELLQNKHELIKNEVVLIKNQHELFIFYILIVPLLKFSMLSAGRGSNFEAIMQRVASKELAAECISLITYARDCKAIDVAAKYGVPSRIVEGNNLLAVLQGENPDLVVMSGYMRKISEDVLEHFENKILNIHPSLLPSFGGKGCYGIHVHEKAIAAGVKISGVTVHIVNKDYDSGKILAQTSVPVLPNDTPEDLAKRVLKEEHNTYWQVIRDYEKWRIKD